MLTDQAIDTDKEQKKTPNSNSQGGDASTFDELNTRLRRHSEELKNDLMNLLEERSDTIGLSDDSDPDGYWDNTPLSDEDMDNTVIHTPSGGQALSSVGTKTAASQETATLTPSATASATASRNPSLSRQNAIVEVSEEQRQNPLSSPTATREAKIKEKNHKRTYRRSYNYLYRYVDRDPNMLTDKDFREIRLKLGFMRKFEVTYPHIPRRTLPLNRIPLSKHATNLSDSRVDIPMSKTSTIDPGIQVSRAPAPLRTLTEGEPNPPEFLIPKEVQNPKQQQEAVRIVAPATPNIANTQRPHAEVQTGPGIERPPSGPVAAIPPKSANLVSLISRSGNKKASSRVFPSS
ncbi:uncharacterized protein [Musca autumnalis]|uniref:uncharacterized protein n=1 Tax=Musca autumnalis TaxID=221902 RepID=UPI003CF8D15F